MVQSELLINQNLCGLSSHHFSIISFFSVSFLAFAASASTSFLAFSSFSHLSQTTHFSEINTQFIDQMGERVSLFGFKDKVIIIRHVTSLNLKT